jgi:hypothetical protein
LLHNYKVRRTIENLVDVEYPFIELHSFARMTIIKKVKCSEEILELIVVLDDRYN